MEPDDLAALFAVCAAGLSPAGRRDAAILAALYGAGLGRAELCGLDLGDFDAEDCSLTVRGGKRRTQREVYLNEDGCDYVKAWIAERGDETGPLRGRGSPAGQLRYLPLSGEDEMEYTALRSRREPRKWEGLILEQRFGPLPPTARRRLAAVTSLDRLAELGERLLQVESLAELGLE